MGRLLTGNRKILSSGLIAVETSFGWTLMGKVSAEEAFNESLAMAVTSVFINEAEVSSLWRLDLIGINDPIEKESKHEVDFLETVTVNNYCRWIDEGIIENVPTSEVNSYGNYLPHRPVLKASSSTTPVRPVFDASAKLTNHPSLNQCLQCGPNLIEFIRDVLLRFRKWRYGIIEDIRKAFLQISIRKEDRDFLRFLW
ncbi:hypothetical protein X975_01493, partial [Stegodyphus mimosarum]